MLRILQMLFMCLLFVGCDDPKSKVIPKDIAAMKEDASFKKAVDELSEKEKKLLAAYMIRMKMKEAFLKDESESRVTIAEAIKLQQEWLDKRSGKVSDASPEQLSQRAEMLDMVKVSLTDKGYYEGDYKNQITLKLRFSNKSGKDIQGVKGVAVLKDIFGDKIKNIRISYTEGLKAQETKIWSGVMRFNQFMSSDIKLKNTDLKKIKFEWVPEMIIFEDGSELSDN